MDAIKFIKELNRMCKTINSCINCHLGDCCPYDKDLEELGELSKEKLIKIIEIVDKWSKEHPAKTRQSEFLKMFPNSNIVSGVINIRPCYVCDIKMENCPQEGCEKCRKDFWLAEVE